MSPIIGPAFTTDVFFRPEILHGETVVYRAVSHETEHKGGSIKDSTDPWSS